MYEFKKMLIYNFTNVEIDQVVSFYFFVLRSVFVKRDEIVFW